MFASFKVSFNFTPPYLRKVVRSETAVA